MNKPSLISVIVVTYNQEKTIARTLDSILNQQCHLPVEIVIGEDCSTDHTREICQEYAGLYPARIRLYGNDHNKGVIDNYFDCMQVCRGELIADCAGDDFWVDDHKLEKALQLMETDEHISIVHTAWCKYHELTKTTTKAPETPFPAPLTNGEEMLEAILTQTSTPVIHLCTSLYRKDIVMQAYSQHQKYFTGDWGCEDLQTVFFLAKGGRVAYLPDITLYYSQGEETISSTIDERKLFNFYRKVTDLSYCLSKEYHIISKNTNAFFSQRSYALLMHAFRAHDQQLKQEAVSCLNKWEAQRTFKFKMIEIITSNETSWRGMLQIRSLFVRIKRALY